MFGVLLVIVVTMHLLVIGWAVAGPFLGLWLAWRERHRGDSIARAIGKKVLGLSLAALVAAIVLGVAAVALLWKTDRHPYFDAAAQVPVRRYWFGLVELAFSLVCLAAAWRLWPTGGGRECARRFWTRSSLMLLAATNLTYHFPPLFSVIGVYCTRPDLWGAGLPFTTILVDPEVFARTLHHLLASFAIAGSTLGHLTRISDLPEVARDRVAAWGGRIALAAVAGQLLSGTYVLVEMPAASRDRLMGGDLLATLAFAASLLATVALLHSLAVVSLGDVGTRRLATVVVLLVLVVFLMVAARQRTRQLWGNREQGTEGVRSQEAGSEVADRGEPPLTFRPKASSELLDRLAFG
jgi:hypothetical protein